MMDAAFGLGLFGYFVVFATILSAYIIFGMAGFGTALIAGPVLVLYLPVATIVPLLALLDLCAALVNVSRDGSEADWQELRRLVPLMVAGSLIGAAILLKSKPDILLLALGFFVVCYSLYAMSGFKPDGHFSPAAALPFGSIGGVFSALFGSGGFIYAIYLSGRIENKDVMRITQTTLIGLSTLTRVVLFAIAGVYLNTELLWLASFVAPGMLLGTTLGRRLTLKMSRRQFINFINFLLLLSGVALIFRYLI